MTHDANGWPDPARPGVPLYPRKSRYHWLVFPETKHFPQGKIRIGYWRADTKTWEEIADYSLPPAYLVGWRYLGPCLTPAEVEARVAETRRALLAQEGARRRRCVARITGAQQ